MNASTHLEHAILNHFFRSQPVTVPPTLFLALYISNPTDSDIGTEVQGGGYVRQPITFSEPQQVNGRGQITNNTQINYPTATANYGTVSHWGVRDSVTGGNLLAHASIPTPRIIESGDEAKFNADSITISVD
jgi:hypothetical protein